MLIYTYKGEGQTASLGGGLRRTAPISLYTCAYMHVEMGKQAACLGRPAWGDLTVSLCTFITYIAFGTAAGLGQAA